MSQVKALASNKVSQKDREKKKLLKEKNLAITNMQLELSKRNF